MHIVDIVYFPFFEPTCLEAEFGSVNECCVYLDCPRIITDTIGRTET